MQYIAPLYVQFKQFNFWQLSDIARIFAFNCWSNTTSYIFQISISMLLTTKGGHIEKSNAWPCHKKGGLAAYKADLPCWFGAKIAANRFIYSLRHEIHQKNYSIRCVGHNGDTLKHTARIFSAQMQNLTPGLSVNKNRWVYFILQLQLI